MEIPQIIIEVHKMNNYFNLFGSEFNKNKINMFFFLNHVLVI